LQVLAQNSDIKEHYVAAAAWLKLQIDPAPQPEVSNHYFFLVHDVCKAVLQLNFET
jgi:hypothetical protein